MMQSRETYYQALFALLQTLQAGGQVVTCGRRAKLLKEMGPGELPALFMTVGDQDTQQRHGEPPKHLLSATVILYAANADRDTPADVVLNSLSDALEAALTTPAWRPAQTLGGLVQHARIEGVSEFYVAPLGERAAALHTIHMLVP